MRLKPLTRSIGVGIGLNSLFGLKPLIPVTEKAAPPSTWSILSNIAEPEGYNYAASVAVHDGKAYVLGAIYEFSGDVETNSYSRIECRNITDGSLLWSVNIGETTYPDNYFSPADIQVDDSGIYVTFRNWVVDEWVSTIKKLDLSGSEVWTDSTSGYNSAFPEQYTVKLTSDSVVSQYEIATVGGYSGCLVIRHDKNTGDRTWEIEILGGLHEGQSANGLDVSGNYVYASYALSKIVDGVSRTYAMVKKMNLSDGSTVWTSTRDTETQQYYESVVCGPGSLILSGEDLTGGTTRAFIEFMDYDTGDILNTYSLGTLTELDLYGGMVLAADGVWVIGYSPANNWLNFLRKYDFAGGLQISVDGVDGTSPVFLSVALKDNSLYLAGWKNDVANNVSAWIAERRTLAGVL